MARWPWGAVVVVAEYVAEDRELGGVRRVSLSGAGEVPRRLRVRSQGGVRLHPVAAMAAVRRPNQATTQKRTTASWG